MKKMRRLIPAIAMLLVSAVMLSTASFAWFTMNEAVTATGMQVKAKASGNLLISLDKMDASVQTITVGLTNDKTEVVPVTYSDGWKEPADASLVDPLYGGLNTTNLAVATKPMTYGNSDYFVDYTVYIATAGDPLTQALYVTMNMTSAAAYIADAYSIAFYVDVDGNGVEDEEFAGYVNYHDYVGTANAGKKIYLKGTYSIPSTFGTNADSKVGLPIIMRVFVDGNLPSETVYPQVPKYVARAAGEKWTAGLASLKFYTRSGNETDGYTYTIVDSSMFNTDTDISGYFTWDGTATEASTTPVQKYYVNNSNIPTGATAFDITIGATDAATTDLAHGAN